MLRALAVGQRQTITTVRRRLAPLRTAVTHKYLGAGEDAGRRDPSCAVGGIAGWGSRSGKPARQQASGYRKGRGPRSKNVTVGDSMQAPPPRAFCWMTSVRHRETGGL